MRDDFSLRTKDVLARRVAFRCSNPDCAKQTSGPADDPSKVVSIGVAAHITAASPGGPRYDRELVEQARRSISNAIWLCADCARFIDSDPERFSSRVLHDWKISAERAARVSLTEPHGQASELATEIQALRNELSASVEALEASRWRPAHSNNAPARAYLLSMLESVQRLRNDTSLFGEGPGSHITIDFSEIYAFVASNTELLVGTPLIDYCLEQSRVPVLMPPGTVYELQLFVRGLERQPTDPRQKAGRKSLEKFIRQYEQAPDSVETQRAYEEALRELISSGSLFWPGLRRLTTALARGLIAPHPNATASLANIAGSDETRHFYLLFERVRPKKQAANRADAINLSVLFNADIETRGRARMISSAPSFGRVAASAISGSSVVRTAREYAILLRSIADRSPEAAVAELSQLDGKVNQLFSAIEYGDTLDERHLPMLQSFADVYRRLFSPIDAMISDALSALPRQRAVIISEFYHELVRWDDLGRAFRNWWDRICADLNAIDQRLETSYMGSEVREGIERCIK